MMEKQHSEHVLVIDDDVELCNLVSRFLVREGFQIDAVNGGAQGIEKALSGMGADDYLPKPFTSSTHSRHPAPREICAGDSAKWRCVDDRDWRHRARLRRARGVKWAPTNQSNGSRV